MSTSLDLKKLERLAFRRTFEDGLLDIYMGGMLASFAVFGFTIFPGTKNESLVTLLYYLLGAGISGLIFWLGKKFITLPRIGLVNFGPARQKRRRDLMIALAAIVTVQVVVVLLQFVYLRSPSIQEWLGPVLGQVSNERLGVAIAAMLFVAPGMLLIAYMTDMPRGYYHAVVVTLGVFLMILLDQAWWMVAGGALIVLPGLVLLVRFLQRYPLEKIPDEHA